MILLLLFILVSAPAYAWETPPCDTVSSNTTEADPQTISYTVGTTTTVNRAVIVQTSWREEGGTITGVTFDGNAMTQIGTSALNTTPTPDVGAAQWVITGVSSGTYTVSVDWSGVFGSQSTVIAITCYGVDQTTPVRVGSATTGTASTDTSVSVNVSSATGDMVIDLVTVSAVDAGEPTIGASQNSLVACVANGTTNLDSCSSSEAGAATTTMSWSAATSENWALHAFSLQPADTALFGVFRRQ